MIAPAQITHQLKQNTTCNDVIDLASKTSDADTQPDPPGFVDEDFLLAGETPQDNLQAVTNAEVFPKVQPLTEKKVKVLYSTLVPDNNPFQGLTVGFHFGKQLYRFERFDSDTSASPQVSAPQEPMSPPFDVTNILMAPLSPPDFTAHNACLKAGLERTHSIDNCWEVNVWNMPTFVVQKRADHERWLQEDDPPTIQRYKWRKVLYNKQQGQELDKLAERIEELRQYEEEILQKKAWREDFHNRLLDERQELWGRYFGGRKGCRRFASVDLVPGHKPKFHVGIQTNMDDPQLSSEDYFLFPEK